MMFRFVLHCLYCYTKSTRFDCFAPLGSFCVPEPQATLDLQVGAQNGGELGEDVGLGHEGGDGGEAVIVGEV